MTTITVTGSDGFDFYWDLSTIANGDLLDATASTIVIVEADADSSILTLTGAFTYNGFGQLTGGTITGASVQGANGVVDMTVDISAFDFFGYVAANDGQGLVASLLAGNDVITGGDANDDLVGRAGDDTILGGGGADRIRGNEGSDTLDGQAGNDYLQGALGDDSLTGGAGFDILIGGPGVDQLSGGDSNDLLIGGTGIASLTAENSLSTVSTWSFAYSGGEPQPDILDGGAGNDTTGYNFLLQPSSFVIDISNPDTVTPILRDGVAFGSIVHVEQLIAQGGFGADHFIGWNFGDNLIGGAGADLLEGRGGNDILVGESGDDTVIGAAGNDTLQGGTGIDTAVYSGQRSNYSITVNPTTGFTTIFDLRAGSPDGSDTLTGVEYLQFSDGLFLNLAASQIGDDFGTTLTGGAFADFLDGRGGDDTLNGNDGDDLLSGGAGNDIINGGNGVDLIDGGDGADTINGGAGADVINGGAGNDIIDGGAFTSGATDTINGEDGDDQIIGDGLVFGSNGNDILTDRPGGAPGTLEGGAGNDTFNGIAGTTETVVSFNTSLVPIVVDLRIIGAQDTGVGLDTFNNVRSVTGGVYDDLITGDDNGNILTGGNGDDRLFGMGGNDTLNGGFGDDYMDGGAGIDAVNYASVSFDVSVDLRISGPQFTGWGGGLDTLVSIEQVLGSAQNDTLIGDNGANTLRGGGGNDLIIGNGGNDFLTGDVGIDTVSYEFETSGVTVNFQIIGAQNTVGSGIDTLTGFENIIGSRFSDTLVGDLNANILIGLDGNDALNGQDGDDFLEGGLGADIYNGANGFDTASYVNATSGVWVDLSNNGTNLGEATGDFYVSIERVVGSAFGDVLVGNRTASTVLEGGGGNDVLVGFTANDTLNGGEGFDTAWYFESYLGAPTTGVTVSLATQGVAQNTGRGLDTLSGIERLVGTAYADTLTGDDNNNIIIGAGGIDVIAAGGGNDLINVVNFNSTIDGGAGKDLFEVDSFEFAQTAHPVYDDVTISLALQGAAQDTGIGFLTLSGIEDLVGAGGDDTLTGDGQANWLGGNYGYDHLVGGGGDDVLFGDGYVSNGVFVNWSFGDDTLEGGAGDDLVAGGSGFDTAVFSGNFADYNITGVLGGTVTITDLRGASPDGTDTLVDIDALQFADGLIYMDEALDNAPVATDGSGSGNEDTVIHGTLPASDPDGNSLEYVLVDGPDHGSVVLNADGSYDYTPNADYNGADAFTFKARDFFLDSNVASISLTITAVNDAAVIGGDVTGSVTEAALLGGLSQTTGQLTVTDIDSAATFVVGPIQGAYGQLTLSAAGAWTYVLDNTAAAVDALSTGDNLVDTIRVTTADGTTANVAITINGSDDIRTGTAAADTINGTGGDDTLMGLGGFDTLIGGAGDDLLDGGTGKDTASYAGAAAGVTVNLGLAGAQNTGGAGLDTLVSIENLVGSDHDDTLSGGVSANSIFGGAGDDVLDGGAGDDLLDGGSGIDTASYGSSTSRVSVNLGLSGAQKTGGADYDTLVGIENLTGSGFNDELTGDGGANILCGGGGADRLAGAGGADGLYGGAGADLFVFSDVGETSVGAADTVYDFSRAEGDRIDLSDIDAIPGGKNNAFALVGAFTGTAGQLVVLGQNGAYVVQGDLDGDGVADFAINVFSSTTLTASDFVL